MTTEIDDDAEDSAELGMPANHGDATLIVLSDADRTAATSNLAEAAAALRDLRSWLADGTLDVAMRYSCLGVVLANLRQAQQLLGGQADLDQNYELLQGSLRRANQRVARLAQLCAAGPHMEKYGFALQAVVEQIRVWWQRLGFSYLEPSLNIDYGIVTLMVKLSMTLRDPGEDIESVSPAIAGPATLTLEQLATYIDIKNPQSYNRYVCDTPKTRDWLLAQIAAKYPQARVHELHTVGWHSRLSLRHITLRIPLHTLSVPEVPPCDAVNAVPTGCTTNAENSPTPVTGAPPEIPASLTPTA